MATIAAQQIVQPVVHEQAILSPPLAGRLGDTAQVPLQASSAAEATPVQVLPAAAPQPQQQQQQQQQTHSQTTSNGLPGGQHQQQQQQSLPPKAADSQLQKGKDPSDMLIRVGKGFKTVEGTKLTEGLFVGRKLGGGMQGGVYEVKDKAGNVDMSQVLKVSYSAALLSNIKREWEIGRRLNNLTEPEAALNGYMGTGAGIQKEDGKFLGMMLERINGDGVNKAIQTRGVVLDIHYIREALFAIFTALDVGQRSYGFHHMDLRMDNVMEQLPPKQNPGITPEAAKAGQVAHHPPTPALVDAQGGANSRFKIIDFGLASFDEKFAAGMVEGIPEKGRQRLHGLRNFHLNFTNINLIPEISPLEKWYRWLWSRKGDVYAVLWDLCRHLDGRTWPLRDRVQVRLLLSLIYHVTGTKILSAFADIPPGETKVSREARSQASFGALSPFEKNDGALHILRIRYIRIKSWLRPRNPGITAAEALCAPFFQYQPDSGLPDVQTPSQAKADPRG